MFLYIPAVCDWCLFFLFVVVDRVWHMVLTWLTHACACCACRAAQVRFIEERSSFLAFLTGVCAIVGGVFTVSGMIDATVYHGQRAIKKKLDLGKLS